MINMHVGDATILLGMPAKQFNELKDEDPQASLDLIKSLTSREIHARIKGKEDSYNGDSRIKYSCLDISIFDVETETTKLLTQIEPTIS